MVTSSYCLPARAAFFLIALCVAGCAGGIGKSVPTASFGLQPPAASVIDSAPQPSLLPSYRLGPLDEIKVTVFKEEDLSIEETPVDVDGTVSIPLIGRVQAIGLTAAELGVVITDRLNARYLRNAQVTVSITKPVNFNVTVDGEVRKPGVFTIPGKLTLIQAIAMAEGTSEFARQDEVVVFRKIDGKRYVARFDLRDIRAAKAEDPAIQQSDIVVVGFSRAAKFQRDFLMSLPGLAGLFIALR